MALAAAVSDLIIKLTAILDDREVNNPGLRRHIKGAKDKLGKFWTLITDAKEKQNRTVNVDDLEEQLLQAVYSSDNIIESFRIGKTLHRRKFLAKVCPVFQLTLLSSKSLGRSLQNLIESIDKAVKEDTVGDQLRNTDEPLPEAPQTGDQPADHDEQTSSKTRSSLSDPQNEKIPEPDSQTNTNEPPAKAPQTDDQPERNAEQTSSEARSSFSDPQNEKIPESEARQLSSAPSSQQPPGAQSSQQPQAEQSTQSGEEQKPKLLPSIPDRSDVDSAIPDRSAVEEAFIGREAQARDLAQQINDRHKMNFLISVVGHAGSGKTTLVRNIYNKADTVQQFPLRAWVNVSEEFPGPVDPAEIEPKKKNLLIDILRQVTTIKEEEKLPLNKLEEKVRDYFIRKRFLVVLDDVRTADMWESFHNGFPNSLNGSRMVLVMRDERLSKQMNNDQGSFTLQNLDKDESWALFLKKVYESLSKQMNNDQGSFTLQNLDKDENWALFLERVNRMEEEISGKSLKDSIFEKCQGLPLAIVVLGGLLSDKDMRNWSDQINRINFGDDPSQAILTLAYQDLASELKPCLLYLGLFRKDYEIPVRRLLLLWAAEGFVKKIPEGYTPETQAKKYLMDLITRNMIDVSVQRLDGSPKKCRVPGILYDNIFPTAAADVGFFHVLRSTNYEPDFDIRRVAAYIDISQHNLESRIYNLHSYMSFNTRKGDTPASEIDRFISKITMNRGFALLTVLDLENVYKPVLSENIGKLIQLVYLGLRWTFLDSIPNSVGDLPMLETLDVKHTNVSCLPISIWNSKKLRHLYMNQIYLDVPLQKPFSTGSLGNLLTLWGLVIGKKSPGNDWFNRMLGLSKLGVTCQFESLKQVTTWISELKKLQSLNLRSIDEYSRPANLEMVSLEQHEDLSELYLLGRLTKPIDTLPLPKNLRMLTLSVSQLEKDPMEYLGGLTQLKILRLFGRSYLGKEMTCRAKGFPQLLVLKLWMLEELEKWTVEKGSMPSLKELEIRRCGQLKQSSGLQNLTTLKELICTNMPQEFVTDIERSINAAGGKVTVTSRDWDFIPLPKSNNGDS